MKEIQEREEAYRLFDKPVVWRDGELQEPAYGTGVFVRSCHHEDFMAGKCFVFDPLTSEFVKPPKPERPYDMTNGQVLNALLADKTKRFESAAFGIHDAATAKWEKGAMVTIPANGVVFDFGLSVARTWREIIED